MSRYIGDDAVRRIVEQMLEAGCHAASVNLVSDVPIPKLGAPGKKSRDFSPGQAWAEYQRLIADMREFFEIMPMTPAETPDDIDSLRD
ncbi:hypothetical protein [Marimonas arenosa]|uniref:Uncharacterized protein n=1 Tax=Marimonas arenosa TaxID=1795305 RepID=A0AAE4B6D0_9RHOB|nr:hypothetical protein [Marimonas arenosa]MDQ2091219.1 hypothetical protein [Marimonas arenosa]